MQELHISIFIQEQQACRAHPRPGRPERGTGPLSERERERERKRGLIPRLQQMREKQNKTHRTRFYIDRSLAFSRDNHVVDFCRPRKGWKFCKVGRSTVRPFLSPLVSTCSCT